MTKKEFKQAFSVAQSNEDLSSEPLEHFYGFGLKDFKPVCATIRQVARLMRYQAQYMDGTWDMNELTAIQEYGRRKFQIIG